MWRMCTPLYTYRQQHSGGVSVCVCACARARVCACALISVLVLGMMACRMSMCDISESVECVFSNSWCAPEGQFKYIQLSKALRGYSASASFW